MDWIWDNFQLILVAAGALAVWLNNRRREGAGQTADYDEDGVPDNRAPSRPQEEADRESPPPFREGSHPDDTERVRRIQEELRRKIAERRGQPVPPPVPQPPLEPVNPLRPVFREQAPPVQRTVPPPLPAREAPAIYDEEAAMARQRRMAEQLAELESRRRDARRAAQALAEAGTVTAFPQEGATRAAPADSRGLAAGLRDPKALRRAMALREVLDPPVALRGAESGPR